MVMNDLADAFHEEEKKHLNLTWHQYWYRLAAERVGSEEEQIADVLAQLRCGSYENKVRADTLERRLQKPKRKPRKKAAVS